MGTAPFPIRSPPSRSPRRLDLQSLPRGPAPSHWQPMAARIRPAPPLPPRPERVWAWAAGLEPLVLLLGFGGRTIGRPAAWPWGSHGLAGAEGERAGCGRVLLSGDGEGPGGVGERAVRPGEAVVSCCARCPVRLGVPVWGAGLWFTSPALPPPTLRRNLPVGQPSPRAAPELPLRCLPRLVGRVYFYFCTLFAYKVFSHFMTPSATPRCDF